MFEKFVDKLKSLAPVRVEFDPATLNDPVALATEWTPAHPGGTNVRTHTLVQMDADRLEFRATWSAILFASFFAVMGLAVAGIGISLGLGGEADYFVGLLLMPLFGLIFAALGIWMVLSFLAPIVFDRRMGSFWRGRTAPDQTFNRLTLKYYTELREIHALQLISEVITGKNSYTSYELNLVLKDGRRIHVVDHGDRKQIESDAQQLGAFLAVPVWDAIDFHTPTR
jgi:hypothetical protein